MGEGRIVVLEKRVDRGLFQGEFAGARDHFSSFSALRTSPVVPAFRRALPPAVLKGGATAKRPGATDLKF
jgi:hypothetical protein